MQKGRGGHFVRIATLAMLLLGIALVAFSAFSDSSFLAILGLAIVFWAAILLYIAPVKHVPVSLFNASAQAVCTNIERVLTELTLTAKGIYLPPRNLKDPETSLVFVPTKPKVTLPTPEQTNERLYCGLKSGVFLTPPGLELSKLFEDELAISFTKTDLIFLQMKLPKLLVDQLELAESVEVRILGNSVTVEAVGNVVTQLCLNANSTPKTHSQVGCLLSSAIACALAKAAGEPVTLESEFQNAQTQTVTFHYRILAALVISTEEGVPLVFGRGPEVSSEVLSPQPEMIMLAAEEALRREAQVTVTKEAPLVTVVKPAPLKPAETTEQQVHTVTIRPEHLQRPEPQPESPPNVHITILPQQTEPSEEPIAEPEAPVTAEPEPEPAPMPTEPQNPEPEPTQETQPTEPEPVQEETVQPEPTTQTPEPAQPEQETPTEPPREEENAWTQPTAPLEPEEPPTPEPQPQEQTPQQEPPQQPIRSFMDETDGPWVFSDTPQEPQPTEPEPAPQEEQVPALEPEPQQATESTTEELPQEPEPAFEPEPIKEIEPTTQELTPESPPEPEPQPSTPEPTTEPEPPKPTEPPMWPFDVPEATKTNNETPSPPITEEAPPPKQPEPEIEIPPPVTPPHNDLLDGIEFPMEATKDEQTEPKPASNSRPTITQKQLSVSENNTDDNK